MPAHTLICIPTRPPFIFHMRCSSPKSREAQKDGPWNLSKKKSTGEVATDMIVHARVGGPWNAACHWAGWLEPSAGLLGAPWRLRWQLAIAC